MKAALSDQKTPVTKHGVRYVESFPISIPARQIDMYKWVTEMSESDYQSYSPAHIAMHSHFREEILFMTNVENIGTDMLVQHYELKYYSATHVQFYSPRSDARIFRWVPAVVGVPWEMQIKPLSETTCELVCLVGVDYPNMLLKMASQLNGLGGLFLRKHLNKEGRAFAKDIENKFK